MTAAVCLVVRNEAASIREWLAYQHVIGFSCCIVYDHASTDGTVAEIRQAAQVQDIRLHRIQGEAAADVNFQSKAYAAACQAYGGEFSHVAFFDADEFLVLHDHANVAEWLATFGPEVHQIFLPWAQFGSHGHFAAPSGLMIESYLSRAEPSFGPCRLGKVIVQPNRVQGWPLVHMAHVQGATRDPANRPVAFDRPGIAASPPDYKVAQLSHFFCRSREHWERRMQRTHAGMTKRTWEDFATYDRGECIDTSATKYAEAVRRQMATTLPWTLARELEAAHG